MPISQHGVPRCFPPPRAPECPFSGLSLTMPRSSPTLALGLAFGSSVTPSPTPELGPDPGVPQIPPIPHLQGQRLVCAHLQENGRSLASLGATRNGQGGRWVPPTLAPTHCAWSADRGAWETAGSLAVNYYAIPVPVSYVHAQPCWSGGSSGGAGPLPGPVQARSGVSGAGTGQAPWPRNPWSGSFVAFS